jgi:hypothetical protein
MPPDRWAWDFVCEVPGLGAWRHDCLVYYVDYPHGNFAQLRKETEDGPLLRWDYYRTDSAFMRRLALHADALVPREGSPTLREAFRRDFKRPPVLTVHCNPNPRPSRKKKAPKLELTA